MSKTYKITFKPAEPYFFGNEKSSTFPNPKVHSGYSNSYFFRSEETPSQTTILGALRFLFLACKRSDFKYSDEQKKINTASIGKASFSISSVDMQEYGVIGKISPVFIQKKNDENGFVTLIPTPMDHRKEAGVTTYTPFSDYRNVPTADGAKLYAADFNVKEGIERSYMSLSDGKIHTKKDVFRNDLRIGINRSSKKDGFFKKEYKMLNDGYSFCVYADLDTERYKAITGKDFEIDKPHCVFLGQGKSAFTVTFTEEENTLKNSVQEFLAKFTRNLPTFIYCLGDAFVSDFMNNEVLFCAVDTKDYRSFITDSAGNVEKGGQLHRLLAAGSIIVPKGDCKWTDKNNKPNAQKIGFNTFVTIGG